MKRRRFMSVIASASLAGRAVAAPDGTAWTSSPVRLVVPASPGGTLDALARLLAPAMQRLSARSVLVDNKAGGAGSLARQYVARGPADGSLLFMGQVHEVTRAALSSSVAYPMVSPAFIPVTMIGSAPNVLVVNPSNPARSVADFVRWAKSAGRAINYGVGSAGNLQNLAGILFQQQTGIRMTSIPYRGSGPALVDLMAGQIDLLFETMPAALTHIESGKLRPLAVTSGERSSSLPDVPTFTECHLPGLQMTTWYGVFVRSGTPRPLVSRIESVIADALADPVVRDGWKDSGMSPAPYPSGENFAAFVEAERKRWRDLVSATGAKLEE